METVNRREFLDRSKRATLGMAAGVTILGNAKSVGATPAADKIVMAIIGCRSRGPGLARDFASRDDCEMAYLADVDTAMFEKHAKMIADCQGGKMPKYEQDFRKVLDPKTQHVDNAEAMKLFRREYRKPWVVEEEV